MSVDTGAVYVLRPKPEPVTLNLPEPVVTERREHQESDTGGWVTDMWPAEHCGPFELPDPDFPDEGRIGPGCGQSFAEDQHVRKMRGWWLHADCARDAITAADVTDAWLLIADQVAARPHKFRASEIRTVLNAVSTIATRRVSSSQGGAA